MTKQKPKAAPVKKFKLGPVAATIWKNEGRDGESFYSIQLDRSYLDPKTGKFRQSSSFPASQISAVRHVVQDAETFLETLG